MKRTSPSERSFFWRDLRRAFLLTSLMIGGTSLQAEQIEMQNGDRYNARVVSMNNESIVIQSDVLGTVKLARGQVANISMGNPPAGAATVATTQPTRVQVATGTPARAATAATNDLSTAVRQLATQTNLIEQVQNQYLTGADPAVKAKFNEMLGGLAAGTISISDLRAQAKSAAEQLRAMKKELGSGADDALDGYLAVLDSFLNESTSETPATQAGTAAPRAKSPAAGGN
jgi:hypothetical protein